MRIYGKIEVCVMKKLDKVDKKIIQILQKNARTPLKEIAAQIVYDPGDADISTSLIESYLEDWTKPDDYNDDPGRLVPGGNETAGDGGMLDVIFRGKR